MREGKKANYGGFWERLVGWGWQIRITGFALREYVFRH